MNIKQLLTGTGLTALGCALIVSNTVNTMHRYPQWLQGGFTPPVEAYEVFAGAFYTISAVCLVVLVIANIKHK